MAIEWDTGSEPTVAVSPTIQWDDASATPPEPLTPKAAHLKTGADLMPSHAPSQRLVDPHPWIRRGIEYGTATLGTVGAGLAATPETLGTGTVPAAAAAFPLSMMAGKQMATQFLGPEPQPLPRTRQTQGFGPGVLEMASNLPRSVEETVRGASTFPLDVANRAGEVGIPQATKEMGLGAVQSVKNLADTEKWVTEPGQQLGTVAMLGGLGRSVYKGGQSLMTPKERLQLRQVAPEVAKIVETPEGHAIEQGLRKIAPRKPSDVQGTPALAREIKNDLDAVQTMAQLKNQFKFVRNGEEVIGQMPKTLNEALSAANQSVSTIANRINDLTAAAGGEKVPLNTVLGELSKVKVSNGYLPNQEALAAKWLEQLAPLEQQGGLSVPATVRLMTNLNNDIKALFTGKNVSGDSPELLGMIANDVRQSLNKTLETTVGSGEFAARRKEMGQLMNLEKRLLKKVEQTANKESKTSMSVFDIIAAEQLIRGVARGKAAGPVEAGASFLIGKALKTLNSPDRAVRSVFRAADKLNSGKKVEMPEIPKATSPTTYFDPTIGARTEIAPAAAARRDLGISRGENYRSGLVRDPSTGQLMPAQQSVTPRQEVVTSTGQPYQPPQPEVFVRDPSSGQLVPAAQVPYTRTPIQPPGPLEAYQANTYYDPAIGARVPRKP